MQSWNLAGSTLENIRMNNLAALKPQQSTINDKDVFTTICLPCIGTQRISILIVKQISLSVNKIEWICCQRTNSQMFSFQRIGATFEGRKNCFKITLETNIGKSRSCHESRTLRWIPTHLTRNQDKFFYFLSPQVLIFPITVYTRV